MKDKANNSNTETNLNTGVTIKPPQAKSFAEDSWATIIANVKAGTTDAYKVGDTKKVTLTSDDKEIAGTYTLRIANKSTPSECSQNGFSQTACEFVVEFEDIITEHKMNTQNTNVGGWKASNMRSYINDAIYNALPNDLKAGIKDTKVISGYSSTNGVDSSNFSTTDKLYLLAAHEVWENGDDNAIDYDEAWNNTRQLDYYLNKGVTTDDYSEAIKYYDGTALHWWLRGAYSNNNRNFYNVHYNGDWYSSTAYSTNGVAPAFRIG